jgi:hypothetical protein
VMTSTTERSPSGKADSGRSDGDRFSFTTSEYKGHAVPLPPWTEAAVATTLK